MTNSATDQWQYLEQRPENWRQQLYVKGRKLRAFTVWMDLVVNELTPQDVAENNELPLAAVEEAILYCQSNQELLEKEAGSERCRLKAKGISFEPKTFDR